MPRDVSEHDSTDSESGLLLEKRLSAAAPVLAGFAFIGILEATSVQHPPRIFASWVVVSLFAVLAVALALWTSARTSRRNVRGLQTVALIVALFSLSFPLMSYYKSYNDFPWGFLAPLLILLIVSGWRFNQKWLSVSCIAIVGFFVVAANEAPAHELPRSVATDDISVTVERIPWNGDVAFTDTSPSGTRVEDEIDVRNIRLEGTVCRLLPVRCWTPRSRTLMENQLPPNEYRLSSKTFPPGWSKAMDLGILVPHWPSESATSVTVPVPKPGEKADNRLYASSGNGIQLSVTNVLWSKSRNPWSEDTVLTMTISFDGYSYSGSRGNELRVRNQNGRTMQLQLSSSFGGAGGGSVECEVSYVDPDTAEFTVDIFTEEQREKAYVYLRFGRLPIG